MKCRARFLRKVCQARTPVNHFTTLPNTTTSHVLPSQQLLFHGKAVSSTKSDNMFPPTPFSAVLPLSLHRMPATARSADATLLDTELAGARNDVRYQALLARTWPALYRSHGRYASSYFVPVWHQFALIIPFRAIEF